MRKPPKTCHFALFRAKHAFHSFVTSIQEITLEDDQETIWWPKEKPTQGVSNSSRNKYLLLVSPISYFNSRTEWLPLKGRDTGVEADGKERESSDDPREPTTTRIEQQTPEWSIVLPYNSSVPSSLDIHLGNAYNPNEIPQTTTGRKALSELLSLDRVLDDKSVQVLCISHPVLPIKYLAAAHLELRLTSGVLLDLDHYAITRTTRIGIREASFLLAQAMKSRTSLISLGYRTVNRSSLSNGCESATPQSNKAHKTYHFF